MPALRIDALFEGQDTADSQLELTLIAGHKGVWRTITGARVQKPALALTGYTPYVNPNRLQVLGMTEISYLLTLDAERRLAGAEALCSLRPAAIVVTRELDIPP